MRTIAIGDIHGCHRSLESLADYASFSPDDTIITLGDLLNRGPDSKGVVDFLRKLSGNSTLIPLMGNHEIMILEAHESPHDPESLDAIGGLATLASYGASSVSELPSDHLEFLRAFRPYHETESHIFVHAGAAPEKPMNQQSEYSLYWEKFFDPGPHQSGKTLICGHTAQRSGVPLDVGHSLCIDTFAYGGGWLTALDVDLGCYWQTNEQGQRRMGTRDRP